MATKVDYSMGKSEKTDRKNEARREKTGKLVPCTGEAHSNPFIDNCMTCAPRWGQMEELAPIDLDAALAAKEDVPLGALSEEQYDRVQALKLAGKVKYVGVYYQKTKRSNGVYYNVARVV